MSDSLDILAGQDQMRIGLIANLQVTAKKHKKDKEENKKKKEV